MRYARLVGEPGDARGASLHGGDSYGRQVCGHHFQVAAAPVPSTLCCQRCRQGAVTSAHLPRKDCSCFTGAIYR